MSVRVRTLGAATIETPQRQLGPSSEVMFGLALYLTLQAGRDVARTDLAAMFWPDSTDVAGRHSLRQMLYRLRQASLPLVETSDSVRVDAAVVHCDLHPVLASTWPTSVAATELLEIGEFLPGVRVSEANGYREWIDGLRQRVNTQLRLAGLRQLAQARSDGRWHELETWAQFILGLDPLSEEATLARAECAAVSGSKAIALEILDRFIEDLGDRPRALALPATTLRRRISERLHDWGGRAPSEVAMIGRTPQMRQLTELIDSARRSEGGSLLLHGAPGIGKTRLCSEAKAYATFQGFRCLTVRADSAARGRPLAIANRVANLLYELPGVAASSPSAIAVLRRLIHESNASDFSDRLAIGHTTLGQISWALTEALLAAAHETSVCIHIDDLHNADSDSVLVLQKLATSIASARVALLATVRSHFLADESSGGAPWKEVARLLVPPLSVADSRVLADTLRAQVTAGAPAFDAGELVASAGGNPLFLSELTTHRASNQSSGRTPTTLARVISERMALLSGQELRLLRVAALLGEFATVPRLRAVLGDHSGTLSTDLEVLESDGLVRLEDSGALVIHECWSEVVQAGIPPATRATLALDCALALKRGPTGVPPLEALWHSAHLSEIGGDRESAVAAYSEAGDRMLARGVPSQAAGAFARALSHCDDSFEAARQSVLLATAHHAAAAHYETIAVCKAALDSISDGSHQAVNHRATLLALLADSGWKAENEFQLPLRALAELLSSAKLDAQCRNFCCLIGIRISYADDGALAPFFASQTVTGERPLLEEWIGYTTRLVFEAESGSTERVRELAHLLDDSSLRKLPLHSRLLLMRHRSVALRFIGALDDAIALSASAARLASEAGALTDAVASSLTLTFALLDDERPEEAEGWISNAMRMSAGVSFDERQRSIRHALARYQLAIGNSAAGLEIYRPHIDQVLRDDMHHRKLVEVACICHAAAASGSHDLTREMLAVALPLVRSLTPSFQLDYAADAVIAALTMIERTDEARDLRSDYLARRKQRWERPIARAFSRLRATV